MEVSNQLAFQLTFRILKVNIRIGKTINAIKAHLIRHFHQTKSFKITSNFGVMRIEGGLPIAILLIVIMGGVNDLTVNKLRSVQIIIGCRPITQVVSHQPTLYAPAVSSVALPSSKFSE